MYSDEYEEEYVDRIYILLVIKRADSTLDTIYYLY